MSKWRKCQFVRRGKCEDDKLILGGVIIEVRFVERCSILAFMNRPITMIRTEKHNSCSKSNKIKTMFSR